MIVPIYAAELYLRRDGDPYLRARLEVFRLSPLRSGEVEVSPGVFLGVRGADRPLCHLKTPPLWALADNPHWPGLWPKLYPGWTRDKVATRPDERSQPWGAAELLGVIGREPYAIAIVDAPASAIRDEVARDQPPRPNPRPAPRVTLDSMLAEVRELYALVDPSVAAEPETSPRTESPAIIPGQRAFEWAG